jgi:ectoine hydroxylase-related dioxygenase (phytanoyl-CoA dioxygenase family)
MELAPALEHDGFYLLRGAFAPGDCDRLQAEWDAACATNRTGVMRNAAGTVYGARNVLDLWPDAVRVMHQPALMHALQSALGPDYGLVRVLYFDKPPGDSWALPWHKDMAIAVKDNTRPSNEFGCPTAKYGVPHVEAPQWLLEEMLTARLHLDDVSDENGPLRVLPGSHGGGKDSSPGGDAVKVLCNRGDVLLMRPLLAHCSGHSVAGTNRHRRILHLEFSGVRELPDGYEWHTYVKNKSSGAA